MAGLDRSVVGVCDRLYQLRRPRWWTAGCEFLAVAAAAQNGISGHHCIGVLGPKYRQVLLLFWLGMMSLQSGLVGILLAPFALAGAYLGVYAHGIIPERLFFKLAFFCCLSLG